MYHLGICSVAVSVYRVYKLFGDLQPVGIHRDLLVVWPLQSYYISVLIDRTYHRFDRIFKCAARHLLGGGGVGVPGIQIIWPICSLLGLHPDCLLYAATVVLYLCANR